MVGFGLTVLVMLCLWQALMLVAQRTLLTHVATRQTEIEARLEAVQADVSDVRSSLGVTQGKVSGDMWE